MTQINFKTLQNDESFSPEYRKIELMADKQLRDDWAEKGLEEYHFIVSASSLTELYDNLYDISQSNDCFPSDAKLYIEDKLFAEMVGGFHLKLSEDFPMEVAEKYMGINEIEFVTSNVRKKAYGEDEVVDGITLYRDDGYKAYKNVDHGNHIRNKEGRDVFQNQEEVMDALQYYMKEEASAHLKNLDKTKIILDGKELATIAYGKEIGQKVEEPKQERKNRRKLR